MRGPGRDSFTIVPRIEVSVLRGAGRLLAFGIQRSARPRCYPPGMKSRKTGVAGSTAVRAFGIVAVGVCLTVAPRASRAPAQGDNRQERVKASVARVFDTSVLHRIDMVIAPDAAR